MNFENFRTYKDANDLISNLKSLINPDVTFRNETDIVYMKKETENGLNYLFVNAANNESNTVAELCLNNTDTEKGHCKLSFYNPLTEEKTPIDVEIKSGKAILDLHLSAYGFTILIQE